MGFSNVKEFSAVAERFVEYGMYTKEPVGSKSWTKFWEQERDRCINGYNTGYDCITGYHYNLLNYSPILQTEVIKEADSELGQNKANRVKGFPKFFDEQYKFFHYIEEAEDAGAHAQLLGSRGRGKSIMCASMGSRNYHHIRDSKSYYVASREPYLLGDGIIPKVWDIMDFVDSNTPWAKRRHQYDQSLHRKANVKIINAAGVTTYDPRSYNSEIIGITVGDNINKTRGIRGKLIIYEEQGSFNKSEIAWNINRESMEDGKNTFGLMLGIGTGGDPGGMKGMQELFYNPRAYNIHPVTNQWDPGLEGTECGFFYSTLKNYGGAMDEDGNSDETKALKLLKEKYKLAAQGNDPHALTRRKAENPMCPKDAFMRITGTQFPVADLSAQEAELASKPYLYKDSEFVGRFDVGQEGKIEWRTDPNLTPIRKFPEPDNKNMPGAIVIYQHPKTVNESEVPYGRYVAGIDSYDFDESTTTSLGSCFIGDLWTGRIVAEYTGRPTAHTFFETCRRLLIYYKAVANIENLNKGIFDWFDNKACGYLICDELDIVREATNTQGKSRIRRRGTTPSEKLNEYARGLLAQQLLKSTNNKDKPEEMMLHTFRSIPAIQEMVMWNPDGNFDRVSALMMLSLIMQDREKYTVEKQAQIKTLAQDDFWNRVYKTK